MNRDLFLLILIINISLLVSIANAQLTLISTKAHDLGGQVNGEKIPGIKGVKLVDLIHVSYAVVANEKLAEIDYSSLGLEEPPIMILKDDSNPESPSDSPYFYIKDKSLYAKYSGLKMFARNLDRVGFYITFITPNGNAREHFTIPVDISKQESEEFQFEKISFCNKDEIIVSFKLDYEPRTANALQCFVTNSDDTTYKYDFIRKTPTSYDLKLSEESMNGIDGTEFPVAKNIGFDGRDSLYLRLMCISSDSGKRMRRTVEIPVCDGQRNMITDAPTTATTVITTTISQLVTNTSTTDVLSNTDIITTESLSKTNTKTSGSLSVTGLTTIDFSPETAILASEVSSKTGVITTEQLLENGFSNNKSVIDFPASSPDNAAVTIDATQRTNNTTFDSLIKTGFETTMIAPPVTNYTATYSPKPTEFKITIRAISEQPRQSPVLPPTNIVSSNASTDLNPDDVILENNGSLVLSDEAKEIFFGNSQNDTTQLILNDPTVNTNDFEEEFPINFPTTTTKVTTTTSSPFDYEIEYEYVDGGLFKIPKTTTSTRATTPPIEKRDPVCFNDADCNDRYDRSSSNICLKLGSLKFGNLTSPQGSDALFRIIQFLAKKDPDILTNYNKLAQMLIYSPANFQLLLSKYKVSVDYLQNLGVCLCDSRYTGAKCEQKQSPKPNQCDINQKQPACNPNTGIYRPSTFMLTNKLQTPSETTYQYKSYYCECTASGVLGVNCEYQSTQCQANTASNTSFLGAVEQQMSTCNQMGSSDGQLCYPKLNSVSSNQCLPQKQLEPLMNYLTFDQTKFTGNEALSLTQSNILTGIQDLLVNEVIPRYSYDDYTATPTGPLAILLTSVDMPGTLNYIRDKMNALIFESDVNAKDTLTFKLNARIDQLLRRLLSQQGKQNTFGAISDLRLKLNVQDFSSFSTDLWSMDPKDPNVVGQNLFKALDLLKKNVDSLTDMDGLLDALKGTITETTSNVNVFNFNGKQYNLLRVDILAGLYQDTDGEISMRPTPGLFLQVAPNPADPLVPSGDIIFLPGVFNPASDGSTCSSIFMAGVWSASVDCYSLNNLENDPTKYLNKFDPMKLPFNLNEFLSPGVINIDAPVNANWKSYPILTPLDFSLDSDIEYVTQNEKFMSNLFSGGNSINRLLRIARQANQLDPLNRVVSQQKKLDQSNLASTQIISNPSGLSVNNKDSSNCGCFNPDQQAGLYNPGGIQFYELNSPSNDVSIMPFILYDKSGSPISNFVVQSAISKYCSKYQNIMNEFHARICKAQLDTNTIVAAQVKLPNLCAIQDPQGPVCASFLQYSRCYFNQLGKASCDTSTGIIGDYLPLIILASVLGLLWLLGITVFCCCACLPLCCAYCCPCCFGGYWKRFTKSGFYGNKQPKGRVNDPKWSVFQRPNPLFYGKNGTNEIYFTGSSGRSTSFRPKNFKENPFEPSPFQLKRLETNIVGELSGQNTLQSLRAHPFQNRIGYLTSTLPKPFTKQPEGSDIKIMPPSAEQLVPVKDLTNQRSTYISVPSNDWRPIPTNIISKYSSSTYNSKPKYIERDKFCSSCHKKIFNNGFNLENNPTEDEIVICADCHELWYPMDTNPNNSFQNVPNNKRTAGQPIKNEYNVDDRYDPNEYNNLEEELVTDDAMFDLEQSRGPPKLTSRPHKPNIKKPEPIFKNVDSDEVDVANLEEPKDRMVVRRKMSVNPHIQKYSFIE